MKLFNDNRTKKYNANENEIEDETQHDKKIITCTARELNKQ